MRQFKVILFVLAALGMYWLYQDEIQTYLKSQMKSSEISVSEGNEDINGLDEIYRIDEMIENSEHAGYTINSGFDRNGNGVLDNFEVKSSFNIYKEGKIIVGK